MRKVALLWLLGLTCAATAVAQQPNRRDGKLKAGDLAPDFTMKEWTAKRP